MVRLRIGDLVKSNYSKFNLARLFGYMSPNTKFDGESGPTPAPGTQTQEETAAAEKAAREASLVKGNYFKSTSPLDVVYEAPSMTPPIVPGGQKVELDKGLPVPPGLALEYDSLDTKSGKHIMKLVERTPNDLDKDYPEASRKNDVAMYDGSKKGPTTSLLGRYFLFSAADLVALPSTKQKIDQEVAGKQQSSSPNYSSKALAFMDDSPNSGNVNSGNAISRAFRSSGGKGLAGFIESMSFDWYDRTTWEVGFGVDNPTPSLGRRAPKMCKVTISFSPIHDITPGLDYTGANRAPIYPVGSHAIDDLRSVPKTR